MATDRPNSLHRNPDHLARLKALADAHRWSNINHAVAMTAYLHEGLTIAEIARRMGKSAGTVSKWINQAAREMSGD